MANESELKSQRLLNTIRTKTGRSLGQWLTILRRFTIEELQAVEPELKRMVDRLSALAKEEDAQQSNPARAPRKAKGGGSARPGAQGKTRRAAAGNKKHMATAAKKSAPVKKSTRR
jgi:hypothetical protein